MRWWEEFKAKENNKEVLDVIKALDDIDRRESDENVEQVKKLIQSLKGKIDKKTMDILQRKLRISINRIERSINENFGNLIKNLRTELGYSLHDMQNMTGISASYINRLEKNNRKAPSYKIIKKLSTALGVSEARLLEVAGLEKGTDVTNIDTLFYSENFRIGDTEISKKQKDLLLKIIKKIHNSRWDISTKHVDSIEIIELVDEYKNL